jgi:hypothetical protein
VEPARALLSVAEHRSTHFSSINPRIRRLTMRRNSIDQHLSSEGTIYLHAFRAPTPSANTASSRARVSDVALSADSLTANAMKPSLSGA